MTNNDAYAQAGVDTQAGDRAVELMKAAVASTHGHSVVRDLPSFAGDVVDVSPLKHMDRPLLVSSTDGVGTKVAIAQAMGIHHTIGQDLVAMVVDDLSPVGAEPLTFTDYIACGRLNPERVADIVSGIAAACRAVGVPLVGGETAEHPGLLDPDEYDVAGASTGVVDAPHRLGPRRVEAGDMVVGFTASGLHSNGFSLIRRVFKQAGWAWDQPVDLDRPTSGPFALPVPGARNSSGDGAESAPPTAASYVPSGPYTLGEAVLEPTRLYSKLLLAIAGAGRVAAVALGSYPEGLAPSKCHAFAHVTGGGLAANLARVIPAGLSALVRRDGWVVPPIFSLVGSVGGYELLELEDTLNLGIGMVAVLDPIFAEHAMKLAAEHGIEAIEIGQVVAEDQLPNDCRKVSGTKGVHGGSVALTGQYRIA